MTDTNQASEDEPLNQHLVCLWQLQDIEETIADASPEELADLHSKLAALSTDITEAVQSAIRTEKLKLLAEVRERVVGTKDLKLSDIYGNDWRNNYGYAEVQVRDAANHLQRKQLNSLTKLEAEL